MLGHPDPAPDLAAHRHWRLQTRESTAHARQDLMRGVAMSRGAHCVASSVSFGGRYTLPSGSAAYRLTLCGGDGPLAFPPRGHLRDSGASGRHTTGVPATGVGRREAQWMHSLGEGRGCTCPMDTGYGSGAGQGGDVPHPTTTAGVVSAVAACAISGLISGHALQPLWL
ncbi:hypothetical protein HaLaN_22602 [Haematococcus lacustris]|uniref:Uncharacterized protein n=1 Tax=Haematococcus lacustris TaxID=44745 RepID=A0A699ZYI2_HAELA|nr:hypothetical protein HaLaN_22602 [Haematococcus lacustris]